MGCYSSIGKRDSYGQTHTLTFVDHFGCWLTRRALLKTVQHLPQSLSVLELGSGYHARNLRAIEDQAEQLVAIDFNLSEELKRNRKFHCIESSIEDALPLLKENTFDLILVMAVLEHLCEPLSVLAACYKLLKKNGILIVSVPTWTDKIFLEFSAFKLNLSPKEEVDDHKMYYTKKDLWLLLIKAGFLPSKVRLRYAKFGLHVLTTSIR